MVHTIQGFHYVTHLQRTAFVVTFNNTHTSKSAIEEFPVGPGYVGIGVSILPFTYQKVSKGPTGISHCTYCEARHMNGPKHVSGGIRLCSYRRKRNNFIPHDLAFILDN